MGKFITRDNLFYRFQQLIILLLHLFLLKWMFYTLSEAGTMSLGKVFAHFTGMALFGAFLIRGCAYWGRHHFLKEQKRK